MELTGSDIVAALAGGALIGSAASLLLATTGRVAGISGIVGGVVCPRRGDVAWRVAFFAGLVVVGAVVACVAPAAIPHASGASVLTLAGAGLIVGFGTRLGNGCTSGHGVCGIARLSPRSLAATAVFIAAGMITVALTRGGV